MPSAPSLSCLSRPPGKLPLEISDVRVSLGAEPSTPTYYRSRVCPMHDPTTHSPTRHTAETAPWCAVAFALLSSPV